MERPEVLDSFGPSEPSVKRGVCLIEVSVKRGVRIIEVSVMISVRIIEVSVMRGVTLGRNMFSLVTNETCLTMEILHIRRCITQIVIERCLFKINKFNISAESGVQASIEKINPQNEYNCKFELHFSLQV